MSVKNLTNYLEDEFVIYHEEPENSSVEDEENDLKVDENSTNIPLDGSALYPKIYVGDSALPLMGQFNQSEYVDDNITRTWSGILTSYYG